ncbi:MAG: chemotaxis protein CheW [Lachnospiraceae bacterium]|nr:chemotaxis protein CheW [Lachnospiraceae bacterium]
MAYELTTTEKNELSTNQITQYIVVNIGEEQYGVDISFIDNIVRMQSITRVPKVPSYLKGVINLRGVIVPVMSLRIKMGLEPDEITKDTRIIIIKTGHELVGIMVDSVKEVVNINSDEVEKVSFDNRDEHSGYVMGVGKQDGALISLLDINAVFAEA